VDTDIDLLGQFGEVSALHRPGRAPHFRETLRAVQSADVVVSWFSSWHTLLPLIFSRLLHRPSVLIVGGYDVARIADIGYGHALYPIRRMLNRLNMWLADRILPFSEFSSDELQRNMGIHGTRVRVVPLGVPDEFGDPTFRRRAGSVLTVAEVNMSNLDRKGLRSFAEASALQPDRDYELVGQLADPVAVRLLQSLSRGNLSLKGWMDRPSLLRAMRAAGIYVQASRHEGFGLAVAEAMLAGCIPVVTRMGSLPEVVGRNGVYLEAPTGVAIASAVSIAAEASDKQRIAARQHIIEHFSASRRAAAMGEVIEELVGRPPIG
jgi:glycosyltransferase involved in cell wall biosynthesis